MPKYVSWIAIALFALAALLPLIFMVAGSLVVDGRVSLSNYRTLLSDSGQRALLFNSVLLAFGVALGACLIGAPLAFLLQRTDLVFKNYLRYAYLLTLLIPPYMSAVAWIHRLGRYQWLNQFFVNMLGKDEAVLSVYNLPAAIFVLTLYYFPFITLMVESGLQTMNHRLEEAGSLCASPATVLRRITLPLIYPYLASGAIFVFIFAITEYGVPALLGLNVYTVVIFAHFSAYYNEAAATASAMPLVAITVTLVVLQRQLMGNRSYVTMESHTAHPSRIRLGKWQGLGLTFSLCIISLSVVVPIVDLLIGAGSLSTYQVALKTAERQIISSFLLSAVAATLIVILALFIAYFIEKSPGRGGSTIDLLTVLPFAFPATVLGIGLIKTWNRPLTQFIYGTYGIIVIALIARFIPFTIRVISSTLKSLSKNLEEAAGLSEPRWTRNFWKILVPLSRPGLIAGWVIAFILSSGEIGATLLVAPPGEATLPIRIHTLLHYGASKIVCALCVIAIIMTFLPVAILVSCLRRLRKFEGYV
ncbi:MAG: iron ABC transporter permease [Acidobacteria bacterium]|nr:iron ABC transporter permease [Acidobacteriota bacterium]MBI3655099.1 iron ABC transporter permease [Acidobacteriota bacterium]